VVPEIAARAHVEALDRIVGKRHERNPARPFREIDGIAAAAGPGLIGGVIVGLTTRQGHRAGQRQAADGDQPSGAHALTARLVAAYAVSLLFVPRLGGHTQILAVARGRRFTACSHHIGRRHRRAFDKNREAVGPGYPGGPQVRRSRACNATRLCAPDPMQGRPEPDFSLSGLKTRCGSEPRPSRRSATRTSPTSRLVPAGGGELIHDRLRAGLNFRARHGAPTADGRRRASLPTRQSARVLAAGRLPSTASSFVGRRRALHRQRRHDAWAAPSDSHWA